LGLLFVALSANLHGAAYNLVDLGANDVVVGSSATGMNEAGVVIGRDSKGSYDVKYSIYPAIFEVGSPTTLLGGNHGYGTALGINSSKEVVGEYTVYYSQHQAAGIFYTNRVDALNPFNGSASQATGINDAGDITGFFHIGDTGRSGAFVYHNGHYQDLGHLPGDDSAGAYGINRKGWVTGWSAVSGPGGQGARAFLYSGGRMSAVAGSPGHDFIGYAISDRGDIAGGAYLQLTSRAFVYSEGIVTLFGPMKGDKLCVARDINSFGQAVGESATQIGFIDPQTPGKAATGFIYTDGQMIALNTLINGKSAESPLSTTMDKSPRPPQILTGIPALCVSIP
jgi:probable HAF family extracellular repeat protein